MKYSIITILISCSIFSQSISKSVIGTAGKNQNNGNLKISWTSGEPVVGLMTAGNIQLGNGYYPAMDLKALSIEDNNMELQIKVYPNPTSQMLYVSHPEINVFSIQISDLNGQLLYKGNINKSEGLNVSSYSQGMYLVTVENKEVNKKNTYKIIKK